MIIIDMIDVSPSLPKRCPFMGRTCQSLLKVFTRLDCSGCGL